MPAERQQQGWFWATLVLSSVTITATVFAFWELVENRFFRNLDYVSLHYLYISRGITSSLFLAMWAAWFVIRQRRRSEEELRRSQERYLGLLDASPSAVVLIDSDLKVCEWNAAAERMYGFSKQEALAHELPTVPLPQRTELIEIIQTVVCQGRVLDRESHRRTKTGKMMNVQVSVLPYRENGSLYFLEVTTDISERIRLRDRLIEFEKLTAMGKMAAGTAHHLNTPLASMLLRVQMMRSSLQNAGCSNDLEHLEKSINFCQEFVRRLLEFSRHPAAQKQPESLASIVEAVAGFVSPSLSAKAIGLNTEYQDGVAEVRVLGDRNQLETVLLILLSNSLDASSQGGNITVRIENGAPEAVQIAVIDEGYGLSPEVELHLFEPFYTTKPSGKGTGLGLALAKSIVAEHGGTIALQRRSDQGAIATVTLPTYKRFAMVEEASA